MNLSYPDEIPPTRFTPFHLGKVSFLILCIPSLKKHLRNIAFLSAFFSTRISSAVQGFTHNTLFYFARCRISSSLYMVRNGEILAVFSDIGEILSCDMSSCRYAIFLNLQYILRPHRKTRLLVGVQREPAGGGGGGEGAGGEEGGGGGQGRVQLYPQPQAPPSHPAPHPGYTRYREPAPHLGYTRYIL